MEIRGIAGTKKEYVKKRAKKIVEGMEGITAETVITICRPQKSPPVWARVTPGKATSRRKQIKHDCRREANDKLVRLTHKGAVRNAR